ncbi:MAG TPA: four helix bundle protein [Candidatus Saccharimonadales bacterium]|nr:four helix bundle protein [Candidatus Saccharimonadales bacterium]
MAGRSYKLENLETSKLWKQAIKLAEHVKQFAEVLPHHENFNLADPLYRTATLVTSDIAMALGRGGKEAAFDYRYARGHLFTVKSLVLMAQHYEYVAEVRHILNEANGLLNMVDAKIVELEDSKAKED